MASDERLQVGLLGLLAALCVVLASVLGVHFLSGPPRPYGQQEAPAGVTASIEAVTRELVGLGGEQRAARVRELLSPEAGPEAAEALCAQFRALEQATAWKLAAADGYGPSVVKAVYDMTEAGGEQKQAAVLFERRDGRVVLLAAWR